MSIPKTAKRLFAAFAALVMALAVVTPAFAATITINGNEGEIYTAYKVLDVTTSTTTTTDPETQETVTTTNYSYTTDSSAVANLFQNYATGATVTKSTGEDLWYISWSAENADTLVAYLRTQSDINLVNLFGTAAGYVTLQDETGVISNLEPGYYFVTSTTGSMCMLYTAADSVDIEDKNEEPSVEKRVDETDAQIGDTVTYTVTIYVPADTKKLSLSDTLSNGLTLDADSFTISINEGEGSSLGKVSTSPGEGGTTSFTIDLTEYLHGKAMTITVTYSATINENAVSTNPATNRAEVHYGNNSTSTSSSVTTKTHKITIEKTDGTTGDYLEGAEFQLKDNSGNLVYVVETENGSYRVATQAEIEAAETSGATTTIVVNGTSTIDGLDSDVVYTLVETKAPDGYNLASDNSVTVKTDNSTVVDVDNYAGSLLPSTGGMGTTILYAVGAVLVIAAGVTLVVRRRAGVNA